MLETKTVLFDHKKIMGKKITVPVVLFALSPMLGFLCIFISDMKPFLPNVPKWLETVLMTVGIIWAIALIPMGILLVRHVRKCTLNSYKDFPGCDPAYRYTADAILDLDLKPGKVCCTLSIGTNKERELVGIEYNDRLNVVMYTYIGSVRLVPGSGRNPILATFDNAMGIIAGENTGELIKLMREKNVKLTEMSDAKAECAARAFNEGV